MRTAFTLVGLSRATYNYVEIKFTLCHCVSGIQSYLYVRLRRRCGGSPGGRVVSRRSQLAILICE